MDFDNVENSEISKGGGWCVIDTNTSFKLWYRFILF